MVVAEVQVGAAAPINSYFCMCTFAPPLIVRTAAIPTLAAHMPWCMQEINYFKIAGSAALGGLALYQGFKKET